MQLFELVSPRLFRPLAGPNRAFYAELLLLLWEECRHTADYSISRAEAVSRAEDYFAALAKPLALDADDAGDEAEQPTRDPHTLALGFLLRLRRTGWLEEQPGSYEEEPALAFVTAVSDCTYQKVCNIFQQHVPCTHSKERIDQLELFNIHPHKSKMPVRISL